MPEHFDYFPLYVHQLMSSRDVRKMKAADFGGYMLLLIESFINDPPGYLPNDQEELRDLARMTAEEWAKFGEKLTSKFKKRQGGLIYNSRMMDVIKEIRMKKEKASTAGKAGASARWSQGQLGLDEDADAMRVPSTKHGYKRKEKKRKEKKRKATAQYTSEFDSFWEIYPHGTNRGGKSQTLRNWTRLLKEGIAPTDLLKATRNYIEQIRAENTEPGYIYKASNFVGQARYFEEFMPGTWERPEPSTPAWERGMSLASDFENETQEERDKRGRETEAHNTRVRDRRLADQAKNPPPSH